MRLILAVNNTINLESGIVATAVFTEHGGTVGSAEDAGWRLADRAGSVSPHHVRIYLQDGHFCATPLNDEGMVINGSSRPLPRGAAFSISDGDRWKVGDFDVSVYLAADETGKKSRGESFQGWEERFSAVETIIPGTLKGENPNEQIDAAALLADASDSDDGRSDFFERDETDIDEGIDPVTHLDRTASNETDLSNDPVVLFDSQRGMRAMPDKKDLIDDLNLQPKSSKKALGVDDPMAEHANFASPSVRREGEELEDYLDELANRSVENGLQEIREREEWPSAARTGQLEENEQVDHVVLRPLMQAMGLPVADMPVPEANRLARDAGAALKSAVAGLMAIHSLQGEDRNNLSDTHLHPVEDNPLRLDMSTEEAMRDLFLVQSPVHLNATSAVEESLEQISAHEQASRVAIDAALGAVLAALAPDQLSRRFARYKGHAPRVGDQDAWHWQMYRHYYEEMKSDRQRGLARMFWEIFRQVYDREMRSKALAGLGEER
ncbi:MAG: type VI secretion system-associated FHA domain protein TagH [Rhizobiaceae bacterium]|nr:type VI secretion system-associated FHA domain protein TagH [Rhizobiaceae bacterium]